MQQQQNNDQVQASWNVSLALENAVTNQRADIVERISKSLSTLKPGWLEWQEDALPLKHRYALLQHTLYEARQAAIQSDSSRASRSLAIWRDSLLSQPSLVSTEAGTIFVVSANHCGKEEDSQFLSVPYTIILGTLEMPPPVTNDFFSQAVKLVKTTGLSTYLEQGLAITILMKSRERLKTTDSYSLTAFPCTVFTDWTPDSARLGECLLHESAHSWLNECLSSAGEQLPTEPTWYSPWKERMRPAFGIIHATFAFSLLVRYFAYFTSHAEDLPDLSYQYCKAKKEVESAQLRKAVPSIEEALRCIKNDDIRSMIYSELQIALSS